APLSLRDAAEELEPHQRMQLAVLVDRVIDPHQQAARLEVGEMLLEVETHPLRGPRSLRRVIHARTPCLRAPSCRSAWRQCDCGGARPVKNQAWSYNRCGRRFHLLRSPAGKWVKLGRAWQADPAEPRMTSTTARRAAPASIETRYSWIVTTAAFVALTFSFGGLWVSAVGLKLIAADAGGQRSVPALASALAWLGSGFGGIAMGQIALRFGIRWTVMFGSAMLFTGLALSTLGPGWPLCVGRCGVH